MNICLISQEYPPDTNWGGIATYTQVLARQLVIMGQRVHVVTLAEGDEYVADDMGVTVHRVFRTPKSTFDPASFEELSGLNHGLLYFSQRVYEEIREIHDKEPIDIIEAPETCAQALLTFKRLKGVKTVTRCHTPFFWVRHLNAMEDNPENLTRDALEKMQTECSTVVTSPTHAMAQVVHDKWGIGNIRVIPNFFNLKTYVPDLSIYEKHLAGAEYLLFFGRLEYRKGVHLLAQALPAILERHKDIKAVFVGSDSVYNAMSMKSFIQEQTHGYEDRIVFIENIPHAALYPIIEKAKFVVLPSLWENFPYVCLEAMSLGKAVVASDSGGFPEIIENGKEGILCAPGDVEALKQAILYCMEKADLPALGENARNKAHIFDTGQVVGEMLKFYASIGNGPMPSTSGETLRIGHILRHFPLPSETFVINEIIALQSLGVDIHPISMFPPEQCHVSLMSQVRRETWDISKIDRYQAAEKSRFFSEAKQLIGKYGLSPWYAEFAACVADYVTDNKLQLMHAHFATEAALVAMLVSELTGVPFSFTAHAYDIFIANNGEPGESLDNRLKLLVERAASIVTISDFNKRYILNKTGASFSSKIDVIHCGVDARRFDLVNRNLSDAATILSIGRFVEKKGHEFLIKAFAKIAGPLPDSRLRLVGNGPLLSAMIDLCKELGVQDRVDFLGNIPSEAVFEEMKNADIFVLHSVTAANGDMEGIPVSLMEASATGMPVISTRHSGIPELVIDGKTGLLTDERDVKALADCMVKLGTSDNLRQQLGSAGSSYVRTRFSKPVEAAKLKVAFLKAMSSTLSADGTVPGFDKEKAEEEITYWREKKKAEGILGNDHYKYFFTQHFGFDDCSFSGKCIMDIGCGPRGSLEWASMAQTRVGLEPLADYYRELGTDRHAMQYIAAHAEDVPFPDNFFDLVSSFNSLDHVNDLDKTISEIKRVLKPGGFFLLLTEVNHDPTPCEPITFSWDIVQQFTDSFEVVQTKQYERTQPGIYDSIKDDIPYDHSNPDSRTGIISTLFTKKIRNETIPAAQDKMSDLSHNSATQSGNIPYVSVIIPVYNGEDILGLCLDSLAKLSYPKDKLEVIVVDNCSTDATVSIAKKYKVTVLHEPLIKSSYAARNVGIKAARGELIAFTDADCIVTTDWLNHLVAHWDDLSVGCFAGEIEAYQPEDLVEIFSDRIGILRQNGTLTCPYLPYTQTANSAYRKTVFDKVGLFIPEMTSGGDADIAWRMQKQLGLKIKFVPEALVYHKHRASLQGLFNQFKKYEYGKVLWRKFYPDYELSSVAQRKEELDYWIDQVTSCLSPVTEKFVKEQIDFVDLMSPFLKFIMSLGTYKARTEIADNKLLAQEVKPALASLTYRLKVTVVICTYNRSDLLRESLLAVTNQDYPKDQYEIIVVDNNSTDHTRAVTESLAASSPVSIRYVFEQNQGLSFARNAGIRSAKGEIVAFVDDDIDAGKGWLSAIVDAFDDPMVACAGGPIRPIWPDSKHVWLNKDWEGYLTISEFEATRKAGEFIWPETPWGANISFRKQVFDSVGLFPTDLGRIGNSLLSSEEVNICRKVGEAGFRIAFAPEAIIHHKIAPERITKQWFYHRTYWQGRSYALLDAELSAGISDGIRHHMRLYLQSAEADRSDKFSAQCYKRIALGYLYQAIFAEQRNARDNDLGVFRTLLNFQTEQRSLPSTANDVGNTLFGAATDRATLAGKGILVVDYEVPHYDLYAGSRNTFMYLKLLSELGMKVYFLPDNFERPEPYSTVLENLGIEVLHGDWLRENWQQWVRVNADSLQYVFFNRPNITVNYIDFIKAHTRSVIIYQGHDLHYLRLTRKHEVDGDEEALKEAGEYKKIEFDIIEKSDIILTFSEYERNIIAGHFPMKPIHTVPLFFYDNFPEECIDFAQRKDIMFVGGCGHKPNLDAILWFAKEIFPKVLEKIPDMVFHVIGTHPPQEVRDLASEHIRIVGHASEEELEEYYRCIRMVVIPLRFGAGVKGKTVEALYKGIPLVSTGIGIEGIPGIESIVHPADSEDEFADQIVETYSEILKLTLLSKIYIEYAKNYFSSKTAMDYLARILGSAPMPTRSVSVTTGTATMNGPRLLAFFLPQYHPIPENDEWWGKGFTEWTNVVNAKPQFPGHYQPHLPGELGFYDLRLPEVRKAQADLAREHGIHGFCYYHYWFNGKLLLERPLHDMLNSGEPDFPFCLCWANEPWTRAWDGRTGHVLAEQHYSEEDDRQHIRYLSQFFHDKRYIRVDGKPLFLIYRANHMPDPQKAAVVMRDEARKIGIGEIYLCRVESFSNEHTNPSTIGFDSAVEFQPDWNRIGKKSSNPVYGDHAVHGYEEMVDRMIAKKRPPYKRFPCVTPAWDNSCRRKTHATIFTGSTPQLYEKWLHHAIRRSHIDNPDDRIVFINAWNEWGEGNHLEPDQVYGREYLEATRTALQNADQVLEQYAESMSPESHAASEFHPAEHEREIAERDRELAERERQIVDRDRLLEEWEQLLSEKDRMLAEREQRIQELLNSASWKVTGPLRWGFEKTMGIKKK